MQQNLRNFLCNQIFRYQLLLLFQMIHLPPVCQSLVVKENFRQAQLHFSVLYVLNLKDQLQQVFFCAV